ncbi:MAG: DEDD exonuclease domain-containing protein [Rhodothermales bacterium]
MIYEYAPVRADEMDLNETSFVIVDTETTGVRAASDRVIEIGAVRVSGGDIVESFQQLVNPGCAVPRRITRLTGISSAMVFDQPTAEEVLPDFFDFLGDDVFVAHNLSFDLRFLNAECRRIGLDEVANRSLCTLRLARRLLPGLRSKGLASLVDFYGIQLRRRHRALADAEATAHVMLRFLDQVELEFGVSRLPELLTFQHRRYSDLKQVSRNVERIREEVLCDIPNRPGVYFMQDGNGKIIYVGKAQNLEHRVRSYFTSVEGHSPRIRKMVRSVQGVEWEVTDSELDALLLESRLIKQLQPAYNRAQRRYVNRPFIRLDTEHPVPKASVSAFLHDDGAEYYGPMASRSEAYFVVDLIDRFFRLRECDDATLEKGRRCVYASMDRCTAPCEAQTQHHGTDGEGAHAIVDADYAAEIERVRNFLLGRDASVVERIEARMLEASAEKEYEQAKTYRDGIRRLERMLARREAVATRVLEHNAVLVHTRDDGSPRILIVSRGRHVATFEADYDPDDLAMALDRYFVEGADAVQVYREQEVDELHLLSHWIFVHRDELVQLHWKEGTPTDALVHQVDAALAKTAAS